MCLTSHRGLGHLCVAIALIVLCSAGSRAAAPETTDATRAKAKLAAVRARIGALTNRLGDELKERDALSARLRETELVITAKRQRLDALRAAGIAAERRRTLLRGEQVAALNALQAEQAGLAAQMQAAYMIGRQEQLKLLLNQSSPARLGRTLTYYGYLAEERSHMIGTIQSQVLRLQQLVLEIDQQSAQLKTLENDTNQEVAAVEHARADRADAMAALTKQVATGNQELTNLKREEQAVESLVAELARVLQDFPCRCDAGSERMRGKLPGRCRGA